jgi:hypothetical protein
MQNMGHPLAAMALDFLSAPGKSYMCTLSYINVLSSKLYRRRTSVFKGSLTISRFRHALSDESVWSSTILGSWTELNGAIPEARILKLFGDKGTQPKKRKKVDQLEDTDVVLVTST